MTLKGTKTANNLLTMLQSLKKKDMYRFKISS